MIRTLVTLAAALTLAPAVHAAPHPQAVSLSQASREPDVLVYVKAGRRHVLGRPCHGHVVTEVSAYRWDGSALGSQRWNRAHDAMRWHDGWEGGNVWFNGLSVRNRTARPILFAGWCA